MRIDHRVQEHGLLVRPEGELDLATAPAFREQVEVLLDATGARHLYLDLSAVGFIDSIGIGAILGRYRRLRATGGEMTLVAPGPALRPVLEMSGLFTIMRVVEEVGA